MTLHISIPEPLPESKLLTSDAIQECFRRSQQAKADRWQLRLKAEALHKASRERWVAVSEGLPPTGVSVYVVVKGMMTKQPSQEVANTWGSDANPQWSRAFRPHDITHWRAIHAYPK